MKRIALLGATGSIGRQTLDVVDWFPDLRVTVLTGGANVELLAAQARRYQPELVVVAEEAQYAPLQQALSGFRGRVAAGREALLEAATWENCDVVVGAISGLAGLPPVWAALQAGKDVALANKEVLVAAGELVMPLAASQQVQLLPVDSEHSAIFQCLEQDRQAVAALLLTASGGPFRDWPVDQLEGITADEALRHPTWRMGPKITVDSATLMNKGLEVMEAHWLFQVDYEQIQVVIHPESIIHSLVQYADGALLAHLGPHDMRIPIQYALTYPQRRANRLERLDLAALGSLHFQPPDWLRFPCLGMAYEAGICGGTLPAILNGANEELVWGFLRGQIGFMDIPRGLEQVMKRSENQRQPDLETILAADAWARQVVRQDYLGGNHT